MGDIALPGGVVNWYTQIEFFFGLLLQKNRNKPDKK